MILTSDPGAGSITTITGQVNGPGHAAGAARRADQRAGTGVRISGPVQEYRMGWVSRLEPGRTTMTFDDERGLTGRHPRRAGRGLRLLRRCDGG